MKNRVREDNPSLRTGRKVVLPMTIKFGFKCVSFFLLDAFLLITSSVEREKKKYRVRFYFSRDVKT